MSPFSRRVRIAYWRQYVWFYIWKWSIPCQWLHVRTIRSVHQARQTYLDVFRAEHPRVEGHESP